MGIERFYRRLREKNENQKMKRIAGILGARKTRQQTFSLVQKNFTPGLP